MARHSAQKHVPAAPDAHVHPSEAPTQRMPAVASSSLPSRRQLRLARKAAQRRFRMRMSMAAVTSVMAGFGASTVLTGTGQTAAAVTATPPVTSSLTAMPTADATVPAAFADNAEAADIARFRSAQEAAEAMASEPAVCGAESANGLLSAVMEAPDTQVVMPVAKDSYRLSSHYGTRWSPFGGGYHNHAGTDFAGALGTPIYSIADGTVEHVGLGKDGRSNNLIIIKHEVDGKIFRSWYVHMYDNGLHVAPGETVKAGQHIADIGNNGNSTGPHLHFEIHTDNNGTTVEPLAFLAALGAEDISALCS